MSTQIGTGARPLRVAIVGAGPSGFYAAGALLQQKEYQVSIDIFERLPAPYGLVRYGVAPDHQKIKSVTKVYDRTIQDPRVRYFGNVEIGRDLRAEELRAYYDAVIYAVGALDDRKLGIPGEDLRNVHSATEFVAWYNGHPDFTDRQFDLSQEVVAVIGVGNVAMDVARILAKSVEDLATTDIADYALEALAQSRVKVIHIIARRGPAQAKFTNPEIKELGELPNADVIVKPEDLELDPASAEAVKQDATAARNLETLRELAQRGPTGKPRQIHFHFLRSPREIIGQEGRAVAMRLEINELRPTESGYIQAYGTGRFETMDVGLVMRAIGYRSVPIPGVPFDERKGRIPNDRGRVLTAPGGEVVPGLYVVGWAKRGPTGVIGTNKPDAVETVQLLLEDVPHLTPAPPDKASPQAIVDLLRSRGVRFISYEEWKIIDQLEIERGKAQGRPRVKFTSVEEMLRALEEYKRQQAEAPAVVEP